MRYYLDTEFNEKPGLLELISIGLVNERGDTYYAVSKEWAIYRCNDFVLANVIPYLGVETVDRKLNQEIATDIKAFIGKDPHPEIWGYYADYDWVLFCWLFGTMCELPSHFPHFCMDIKQDMKRLGISRSDLPLNPGVHNALEDAIWTKRSHEEVILPKERSLWN